MDGLRPYAPSSPPATPAMMSEVHRCLHRIERALERGDIGDARSLIVEARRMVSTESAEPRPWLHLVGNLELTDREMATLRLLPDGSMSQKDIARELNVTRNTVKTHLRSLYQKLDVHCRGEAIHRARELGLLEELLAPPIPISHNGGHQAVESA